MQIQELGIKGAWIAQSAVHEDARGTFREWFDSEAIESFLGRTFAVKQANFSSSKKGVLRGIHFSQAREGQGKWVTCISGSIWDVVVDIRPYSPTFRKWIGIELQGVSGDAIFISEGLGHAFISLQDNTSVAYLLTSPYSPADEFEIHPLDPELAIAWPLDDVILSAKDASAPYLRRLIESGRL
jgi:dTDP-4-dehydrorhamnose 3,5-epimerase